MMDFSTLDFLNDLRNLEKDLDLVIVSESDPDKSCRSGAEVFEKIEAAKNKLIAAKKQLNSAYICLCVDRIIDITKRLLIHVFKTEEAEIEAGLRKFAEDLQKSPVPDNEALDSIHDELLGVVHRDYGMTDPAAMARIVNLVESTGRKVVGTDDS